MGSYKWGYKSLVWVISMVTLLRTPLITTHEPPSTVRARSSWPLMWLSSTSMVRLLGSHLGGALGVSEK